MHSGDDGAVLRWSGADVSGVYRVGVGSSAPDQLVAVNPPALNESQQASPSDLARTRPEDLKAAYPDWDLQVTTDPHKVVHASGNSAIVEYEPMGASVAHGLLLAMLALFFCEVVMAWLFGHYSAVPTLEEEMARQNITRRRWLLTRLPWYVASGLLFAFLVGVGLVLIHNAWTGDFLSFLGDGPRRAIEASQGVAAPAEGEASRWNLEYSSFLWNGHYDPWLSGILFAVGAAMVLAIYFREGRNVGVGPRLLMAGLRLGLLVLLLLVVLPQLRVWYERQGWPDVAIILDDSESMSTFDHYRDPKVQAAADALAQQAGVDAPTGCAWRRPW